MKNYLKGNTLAFFIILISSFLVIFFGYHQTDQEFINSLAYRISLGELPYKDFDYVRPPLSIYLHSLSFIFFPDNAVLIGRIIYFLQMLLVAIISTMILSKINYISKSKIISFTLITFLLSLHNFPAMPWHTVDGLLFLILGAYFLIDGISKDKIISFILAGICCSLAVLTKQNFLLLTPFFLFIAIYFRGYKSVYVFFGQLIPLLIFLVFLIYNQMLSIYLESQSSDSSISAIFKSIALTLKFNSSFSVLPSIIFFGILMLISKNGFIAKRTAIIISIFFFVLLHITELYINNWNNYQNPELIYTLMWIASIYFFLTKEDKISKFLNFDNAILILLFLIGLSTMISWGYPYPLLFVAPYLAILLREFEERFGEISSKNFLFSVFTVWLLISNIQYRDSYVIFSTQNLGKLYPKLNLIHTGDNNFTSYQNLKELSEGYYVETVIPEFPLFAYLNNSKSDFRIDWFLDKESTLSEIEYMKGMEGKYFIIMDNCYENPRHPKRISLCNFIKDNSVLINQKENLRLYWYKP